MKFHLSTHFCGHGRVGIKWFFACLNEIITSILTPLTRQKSHRPKKPNTFYEIWNHNMMFSYLIHLFYFFWGIFYEHVNRNDCTVFNSNFTWYDVKMNSNELCRIHVLSNLIKTSQNWWLFTKYFSQLECHFSSSEPNILLTERSKERRRRRRTKNKFNLIPDVWFDNGPFYCVPFNPSNLYSNKIHCKETSSHFLNKA